MNIYIGNKDLRSAFGTFWKIQSATRVKDKSTDMSKCFGFVEMLFKKGGQAAIDALIDQDLKGRTFAVIEVRPRVDYPGRNNRFGSSRRGFGGDGYKRERK